MAEQADTGSRGMDEERPSEDFGVIRASTMHEEIDFSWLLKRAGDRSTEDSRA